MKTPNTDSAAAPELPEEVKKAIRACVESHLAPWANYADKTDDAVRAFVPALAPLWPTPTSSAMRCAGKGEWWCHECKEVVPPEHVTFTEHHDKRCGGCGFEVEWQPESPAPSAPPATGTPTPRTDEKVRSMIALNQSPDGLEHFARTLEIGLVAANAALEEAKQQWRMSSVCREITAQLEQARSDLAQARADGERLDWLSENPVQKISFAQCPNAIVFNGEVFVDLRAAIDAARNAGGARE